MLTLALLTAVGGLSAAYPALGVAFLIVLLASFQRLEYAGGIQLAGLGVVSIAEVATFGLSAGVLLRWSRLRSASARMLVYLALWYLACGAYHLAEGGADARQAALALALRYGLLWFIPAAIVVSPERHGRLLVYLAAAVALVVAGVHLVAQEASQHWLVETLYFGDAPDERNREAIAAFASGLRLRLRFPSGVLLAAASFPFFVAATVAARKLEGIGFGIAAALTGLFVVSVRSKSLAAVALVIVALVILRRMRLGLWSLRWVVLTALALALVYASTPTSLSWLDRAVDEGLERWEQDANLESTSIESRLADDRVALAVVRREPLFGVGVGDLNAAPEAALSGALGYDAHALLMAAATAGLPAALLLVGAIVSLARTFWRQRGLPAEPLRRAAWAGLATILIVAAVNATSLVNQRFAIVPLCVWWGWLARETQGQARGRG
jgi:hypothetical protein